MLGSANLHRQPGTLDTFRHAERACPGDVAGAPGPCGRRRRSGIGVPSSVSQARSWAPASVESIRSAIGSMANRTHRRGAETNRRHGHFPILATRSNRMVRSRRSACAATDAVSAPLELCRRVPDRPLRDAAPTSQLGVGRPASVGLGVDVRSEHGQQHLIGVIQAQVNRARAGMIESLPDEVTSKGLCQGEGGGEALVAVLVDEYGQEDTFHRGCGVLEVPIGRVRPRTPRSGARAGW